MKTTRCHTLTRLLLSCLLLLLLTVTASAADTATSGTCGAEGGNLIWTLDSDGVLTISGSGKMKDDNPAPWDENKDSIKTVCINSGVTSIGDSAFYGCNGLTSITIPESVTSIGNYAFGGCISLTNVYITDMDAWCRIEFGNVSATPMYFAKNIYLNGNKIVSVDVPQGVTAISSYTFYGFKDLIRVTIPDSVTSIGGDTFSECSSLTSIVMGSGVTSIGGCAFFVCRSLTSVTLGSGVTRIGSGAFLGCDSLVAVYITDVASWCRIDFDTAEANPLYCAKNLYVNGAKAETLEIPEGVQVISSNAFIGAECIKRVALPKSLTGIAANAFSGCKNIESVYYAGSESELNAISISITGNDALKNAKVYYNTTMDDHCYSIRVKNSDGGSIRVDKDTAKKGDIITVTVVSDAGYELDAIYVDGAKIKGNTFVVTGDHEVSAAFTKKPVYGEGYIITQVGADGSFCLNKDVPEGSRMIVAGYEEGGRMTGASIYSFSAAGSSGTAAAPTGEWVELRYFLIATDSTPLCEHASYPRGSSTITDFVLTMLMGEDGSYHTAINGELGSVVSGRIFTEQVTVKNSTDSSLEIEDRACITFENCTFNRDVIVEFREKTDVSFDESCRFLNGAKVIVNTPDGYQRPADGSGGLDFVNIDLGCPDGKVESEQALISVFAAKGSFELNGMTVTPGADNSYGRNEYSIVSCIPLRTITLYEVQTSKNNHMTLTGAADRADIIRLCGNVDISGLKIAADGAGKPTQLVEIRSYGVDDLQINIGSHAVEIQESGSYIIIGSGKITAAVPNVTVNGAALPMTCEISNLRFAKQDGYYLLKWDSTARRNISYRVYFNGSSNHETGTGDTFTWLGRIENTVGIRVTALYWDSNRNEVTVADMTNQDLRIQVTNDSAQSGTTAVFTKTTSGGYALEIHNIPTGIDYLFLRIRNDESGNGFYIPVNGATSYSGSVPSYTELLKLIDGGTYTIRGYRDFSLSADEKTLSYHEAELGSGLCIPDSMPQTTTISNVRFDEEDPGILRWDFIRGQDHALTDIRFRIVLTEDNGKRATSGTSSQSALLVPLDGVYTKVLVYAEDRATRTMLQSDGKDVSSEIALTVRSKVGQTISQASAVFTKKDGSYQADITGLTGYEAFFMRVDGDSDSDGTHGRVDSNGTAQRSLSASLLEQTNARYSIYGAKDYRINASGELEFTIDCLCKEAPVTLPAA